MSSAKVSVIIPTYNGADLLVEAIKSVLAQTYPHFELIIVDDASPDHTPEAVARFDDPRLKYIRHAQNQGVNRARITGFEASSGALVAWLDQDDLFHPEKLEHHVALFSKRPDLGLAYNSRFELNHSSTTIREIWRHRGPVDLADQVLGFPIAPSEMVFTREWGGRMDLWEGNWGISGGEIIFTSRLIFEGCQIGHVDRALNYRRHHAGRVLSKLAERCESELDCQRTILNDPRCPAEVVALRDLAFANTYLVWAGYALLQHETSLGQEFLRNLINLNPTIVEGEPCELVRQLAVRSVDDENEDHVALLKDMFAQFPPELARLRGQRDWAVGWGYLMKGTRAAIWDRPQDAKCYFARAKDQGAQIDEAYIQGLSDRLLNYQHESGTEATRNVLQRLTPLLKQIGGGKGMRKLKGSFLVNGAFRDFREGKLDLVPKSVISAIVNDPQYLVNRGVISILVRSTLGMKMS